MSTKDGVETLRQKIAYALRANGVTDRPETDGMSMHSWRCEYPERYGRCTCFQDLIDDLIEIAE